MEWFTLGHLICEGTVGRDDKEALLPGNQTDLLLLLGVAWLLAIGSISQSQQCLFGSGVMSW